MNEAATLEMLANQMFRQDVPVQPSHTLASGGPVGGGLSSASIDAPASAPSVFHRDPSFAALDSLNPQNPGALNQQSVVQFSVPLLDAPPQTPTFAAPQVASMQGVLPTEGSTLGTPSMLSTAPNVSDVTRLDLRSFPVPPAVPTRAPTDSALGSQPTLSTAPNMSDVTPWELNSFVAPPAVPMQGAMPEEGTPHAAHPTLSTAPGLSDVTRLELRSFPVNILDLSHASSAPITSPSEGLAKDARGAGQAQPHFDAEAVRSDFPILKTKVNGKRLVWLDNAATTQKPQSVIDRISYFYENENSNVHRAAHTLAARATDAYDDARKKVAGFLGASSEKEIVFARGATEAINLVAQSWGRANVRQGDEILITWLEHHANIVPWQMLCQATGATLKVAPVDDNGHVLLDAYARLLTPRTKLVSFTQVSNALGTITSAAEMTHLAHRVGAVVLVDGAQAVSHMRVDVRAIGCDFYAFSGHKVFAPTGIGALYGRADILEAMPPWQGGGNMISDVTFDRTTFHGPPMRFEAGTGSIADAVGLGAAIDWVEKTGLENVSQHEHHLLEYATSELERIPGLRILGNAMPKAGVISFVLDGVATETVGKALDQEGVAVRSGHHCAQPILRRFGVESTVRASFAPYNTMDDVRVLVDVVRSVSAH